MFVFDMETKVIDAEIFPQHTIVDLNSGIAFVLFSQDKPLRWKETHTHRHTYTYTNTDTQRNIFACEVQLIFYKKLGSGLSPQSSLYF